MQGTVTDSSGAVVADAEITVTSPSTGFSRSSKTDGTGNYFVSELPIGTYEVNVKAKGFRPATVKAVNVDVSVSQQVNVQLAPGQVSETVVVTEQAPLVEATQDNLGGNIETQQIQELPVSGRDFTKLLVSCPGLRRRSRCGRFAGSFGLFSINGNRGRSNNYLLDGTDMNDGYRNLPAINQGGVFGTPATILPIDALDEVSILNGTEAEYGRNSGGGRSTSSPSPATNDSTAASTSISATTRSMRATTSTQTRPAGRVPQQPVRRVRSAAPQERQDFLVRLL